jgi:hypothetical protein
MIRCRRGIEGMPLKLAVIALAVSVSLPALVEASTSFNDEMRKNRCRSLAEAVRNKAEEAVAAGPGNVRVLHLGELQLGEGMRIKAGGPRESADLIVVSIGDIAEEVRCVDPRALFNGTLDEEIGAWDLVLEATELDNGHNVDLRRSG